MLSGGGKFAFSDNSRLLLSPIDFLLVVRSRSYMKARMMRIFICAARSAVEH